MGWDDDGKTRPGFAVPEVPNLGPLSSLPPPPPKAAPAPRATGTTSPNHAPAAKEVPASAPESSTAPAIEVELVHERNIAPDAMRDWASYQILTKHRVYSLDAELRCIAVIDRDTGRADPKHRLVGAKLVGGQTSTTRGMELSYPFPRVGAEGVFEHFLGGKAHFSHTSTVQRVVARVRVVSIEQKASVDDAWETLTAQGRIATPTK